jgi:hypothetical protein
MVSLVSAVSFKLSNRKPDLTVVCPEIIKRDKTKISESRHPKTEKQKMDFSCPEAEKFMSANDIPDTIHVTYKNDINILLIHEALQKKFAYEKFMLETYKSEMEEIRSSIEFASSINKQRSLTIEAKEIEDKIEKIESGETWEHYVKLAKKHLENYIDVTFEKKSRFVKIGKRTETEEDKNKKIEILKIIENYIKVAKKFITINDSKLEKLVGVCPNCETSFEDFDFDTDTTLCICPNCGWYREQIAKSVYSREGGKTSSNNKNDYEDRENFMKAIQRFCCKQQKNFHPKLEEDLDEYFIKTKLCTGLEFRENRSRNVKKTDIGFQKMLRALTTLSRTKKKEFAYRKVYSDYYEDIWLIMHNYWGIKVNDIEYLIPKLMDTYDSTQQFYNSLPVKERGGRDASLNTQFRLYVQLLAHGYSCVKTDFKIQRSRESLENHQRLWKKMCAGTGTKFYEVI